MEALGVLRFWRNAASEVEARSDVGDVPSAGTDDEETDEDDSFIDLVFNPHNRGAVEGGDEASRNDFQFIESLRDVFLNKVDFSCLKPTSPVTIPRSPKKFKLFMLGFRKPSKPNCSGQQKMASPLNAFSRSSSNRSCHVLAEKSVRTYLNMVKPLYVKISKKVKLMSYVTPSPLNPPQSKLSEGSRLGSFKIVASSLRKSRSASAAASLVRRRDEPSLAEQHDGIQEAILHCKRSYNSSSQEFSQLFLSSTNPSDGKLNCKNEATSFKSNREGVGRKGNLHADAGMTL